MMNYTDKLYENIPVYHPNGKLMFRTTAKRVNWYKDRGLAVDKDCGGIVFTFEPAGMGEPDDVLYNLDYNNCCVCGTSDKLTRHHIVPSKIVKFYEDEKEHNRYNVVPICRPCHNDYESVARSVFMRMVDGLRAHEPSGDLLYHIDMLTKENFHRSILPVMKYRHIPDTHDVARKRKAEVTEEAVSVLEMLREEYGVDEEFVLSTTGAETINAVCKKLAEIHDYRDMSRTWSEHFVATMSPKHLPGWWDTMHGI